MATAAQRFAEFVADVRYADIPRGVLDKAKLHLIDTLGCGLAAHALDEATEARQTVAGWRGTEEASVIGLDRRLPAAAAALANGALCHALDFDDTHTTSLCHVSAVVGPAALAAAEARRANGDDLLTGYVVGAEVVARIGRAAPGAFHARGFHPTSVCGVFGAAAAASSLAGLSAREVADALGIAGSMSSGTFEHLADGSGTKPLHAGFAAQAGVLAAALAAGGATGPVSVLEGLHGLYATHIGTTDVALADELSTLGSRWETANMAIKPYPACHQMHTCLDAASILLNEHRFGPGDVAEVVVSVPELAVPLVLEPAEHKATPRTVSEARFSLPFSLAVLLVHGHADVSAYTGAMLADRRVRELAGRVRYEVKQYPYDAGLAGSVTILTADGARLEAELMHERGSSQRPLALEAVLAKFRANADLALSRDMTFELERRMLALEEERELPWPLPAVGTVQSGAYREPAPERT